MIRHVLVPRAQKSVIGNCLGAMDTKINDYMACSRCLPTRVRFIFVLYPCADMEDYGMDERRPLRLIKTTAEL